MWKAFIEDYGHSSFQGFNLNDLEVDQAYLRITSNHDTNLTVFHKSSDCYRCPYQKMLSLPEGDSVTLKYDTNPYWSFIFSPSEQEFIHYPERSLDKVCFLEDVSMGEFGIYDVAVNGSNCHFDTVKSPVFIYGAVILAFLFYLCLGITWFLGKCIYKKTCAKGKDENKTVLPMNSRRIPPHLTYFGSPAVNTFVDDPPPSPVQKPRIQSLDTFRGITIVLMILVNHGGGKYWFLEHAPWNGFRLADAVFPWFLWIMGVCIPMGLKSQMKKKVPKKKIFLRIVQRSLKLFAIGLILNTVGGHNQLEKIRIPGVLQRFAISYFFTATVYLLCGPSIGKDPMEGIFSAIEDIIVLFPQWVIYILITIGHTVFIFYMPNPGCPRGYLGPGGIVLLQGGQPSPDCIGGVTRMVDILVLGNNHIFQYPTAKSIYGSSSFDPEGILGSVTTLLQVFLGIQAGQILQTFQDHKSRVKRWFIWAFATLLGGLALSSGIIIGGPIPVNKNLWSLSYVFISSATAFFLLAFCYILVDYVKAWRGSPFYQTGMNSIFLYVAHFLTYNVFPWRWKYGDMRSHLALFAEALFGTMLWVIVALYLHKKKKFYTV